MTNDGIHKSTLVSGKAIWPSSEVQATDATDDVSKWQQIDGIYPSRLVQKWVVEFLHTITYPNSWQLQNNDVLNHRSLGYPC